MDNNDQVTARTTPETKNLRQDLRDITLFVGATGIVASLFLLLASTLTTLKITKLAIIGLLFASSLIFYQGLAPKLKKRLKSVAKLHFKDLWIRMRHLRDNWVAELKSA